MHLFVTEDVNIVCADQRTQDKVRKPAMFFPLPIFPGVSESHTYANV